MTSKLKNIHPTLLVMLRLVEKDTSFKAALRRDGESESVHRGLHRGLHRGFTAVSPR